MPFYATATLCSQIFSKVPVLQLLYGIYLTYSMIKFLVVLRRTCHTYPLLLVPNDKYLRDVMCTLDIISILDVKYTSVLQCLIACLSYFSFHKKRLSLIFRLCKPNVKSGISGQSFLQQHIAYCACYCYTVR